MAELPEAIRTHFHDLRNHLGAAQLNLELLVPGDIPVEEVPQVLRETLDEVKAAGARLEALRADLERAWRAPKTD